MLIALYNIIIKYNIKNKSQIKNNIEYHKKSKGN